MVEALRAITFFISFITDSTRIGAVHVKDTKTLDTIATVGNLMKTVIGVATPSPGLGSELTELSRQLKALDRRLGNEMAGLGAFIVQHSFGVNLVVRVNTMNKYMQAYMKNQTGDNYYLYKKETDDIPPLRYAREISSWLMQDLTNPIMHAMNGDPLQSTKTFEKWEKSILTLLNQLLIQETFLNSLFWDSNMAGPYQLLEEIRDVQQQIDELRNEYKGSYWPVIVNQLIHRTQDNHGGDTNERKCEIIRDGLRKVLTDDEFYVMVYDHCGGWEHHAFYGSNCLHSFRRNGCNVVVCRSQKWNQQTAEIQREFRDQLNRINFISLTGGNDDLHYIPKQIKDRIDRSSSVGIIDERTHPVVYAANRFNNSDNGPGGARTVFNGYQMIQIKGVRVIGRAKNYLLIACFD